MDRVSVIVPVYNGKLFLNALVDSIIENTLHKDYEVIFVDDHSTAEDMSGVYKKIEQYEHFRVVYNKENYGFAKSNNIGLKYATGEFIYFLNSDTLVKKGWLFECVKMFRKAKIYFGETKVGAIQSKIILPSEGDKKELVQTCGMLFTTDGLPKYRYPNVEIDSIKANTINFVHSFIGCGVFIEKKLLEQAGGFDEKFGKYYFEDADLALRILELGYHVVYNPFSEIYHFHGMSTSTFVENKDVLEQNMQKSKKYFTKKWPLEKIIGVFS